MPKKSKKFGDLLNVPISLENNKEYDELAKINKEMWKKWTKRYV